jgi:hypothetical protein
MHDGQEALVRKKHVYFKSLGSGADLSPQPNLESLVDTMCFPETESFQVLLLKL